MLDGLLVGSEDGEEGGGELGEVVEHLQCHAHLTRVLSGEREREREVADTAKLSNTLYQHCMHVLRATIVKFITSSEARLVGVV